jgi:hypothetical protein
MYSQYLSNVNEVGVGNARVELQQRLKSSIETISDLFQRVTALHNVVGRSLRNYNALAREDQARIDDLWIDLRQYPG